ncbi:MAG: hypothetical protein H0W74_12790 [Sphingosinicella sp.]|nr:hypothetical protein [Sphingosinicella sp.]
MNAYSPHISETLRRLTREAEAAQDQRSAGQQLNEAVQRHISNETLRGVLVDDCGYLTNIDPLSAAERARDSSEAELIRLGEDMLPDADLFGFAQAIMSTHTGRAKLREPG